MTWLLSWSFQSTEFSETPSPDSDSVNSVEGHSEPSWFKDIKFDDSDTEQIAEEGDDNLTSEFKLSNILIFMTHYYVCLIKWMFCLFSWKNPTLSILAPTKRKHLIAILVLDTVFS